VAVGVSAAPPVPQCDRYRAPALALLEEKGQRSSHLAAGQALKAKSGKVLSDSKA